MGVQGCGQGVLLWNYVELEILMGPGKENEAGLATEAVYWCMDNSKGQSCCDRFLLWWVHPIALSRREFMLGATILKIKNCHS